MEHKESVWWDERYEKDGFVFGVEPNAYLKEQAGLLKPDMKVLLPGDGEGRNGVFLAGLGLETLSVDISSVGLAKAKKLAEERGLKLHTKQVDLSEWTWPVKEFDVLVWSYLHLFPSIQARIHAAAENALKPGGLLIFECFHPENIPLGSGGPKDEAMMYTPEILRNAFSTLKFRSAEKQVIVLDEGAGHQGKAVVTRGLAEKL